jgi:hypothetical protein
MNGDRTAHEALIAEALGDLGVLLDRTQQLLPEMREACRVLKDANEHFIEQSDEQRAAFERQLAALSKRATTQVVEYIAARTDEAGRRTARELRDSFRADLRNAAELSTEQRGTRPGLGRQGSFRAWGLLLTHLAVGIAAAALTWVAATRLSCA